MSPTVFLHADPFVPGCQRALARRALERTFPAGYTLHPSSALLPPPDWQVAGWVAQSLLAKLTALRSGPFGSLYMDARLFVPGDLSGLVADQAARTDAPRLRDARLLWVPKPSTPGFASGHTYDAVADQVVPAESLAEEWQPSRFGAKADALVIDMTPLDDRPWTSPFAPGGVTWLRALRAAIEEGEVTRAELKADVERGRVRPSLVLQLDRDLEDARLLPAGLLDQDVGATFAETSASAERRAVLFSAEFRARMIDLRRRNKLRVKGRRHMVARFGRRSLSALRKLPGRILEAIAPPELP